MSELTPEERKKIYEEEKIRIETELSGPDAGNRMKGPFNKILLLAVFSLIILSAVGGFGYRQYKIHGLKQKLGEALGKDLGLTETILQIESESSHITFGEIFELCNKSVENRTALIVELRGVYPELDSTLKTKMIDYLNAENEFVRLKRDFYRKSLEMSSAFDLYTEEVKDLPSSSYGWDYYRERILKLKTKLVESASEADQSADAFIKGYEAMYKKEAAIAAEANDYGLRFIPVFKKHSEPNQNRAKEAKQTAQLAKMF